MRNNNVMALIFSNMHDESVRDLTAVRSMGSIPIGGRYRLIDFTLSSLVNAGVIKVGVVTKSHYQSLMDHIGSGKAWDLSRKHEGLCFLPPFARRIFHCFRPDLPAFFGFWVKNGSEKILKLQNKSCQAFVQYNFYHVDTRNLECGCRLSILRFRAP